MSESSDIPEPKPAATLVLLRSETSGFSVLLMKRPSRSSFMAGMHVFPGGKVEPGDMPASAVWAAPLAGRMRLSEIEAAAFASAVRRETFEEMGLLPGCASRPQDETRKVREAMASETLHWNDWPGSRFERTHELIYFDHWITPVVESKRFDTRFFAMEIDGSATPEPNQESIAWGFFTPQRALEAVETGEIGLAPPTLVTVQRLARYPTASAALAGLAARQVEPLQPVLSGTTEFTLALPGHAGHPERDRLADNPLAMILRDGKWHIEW